MFQPNSIKTLRDLKLQNQFERGELEICGTPNVNDEMNNNLEGIRESLKQMNQNPIQLIMQNKSLLKDVNNAIDDVRVWRETQKQSLEQSLKKNQIEASKKQYYKSYLNDMEEEEKEDKEYLEKQERSKNRFDQLRKNLKLDSKLNQQYTQSQMSSEAKTDYVNRKLAESDTKLNLLEVEKLMSMLEYSSVMHNQDIAQQIEKDYSLEGVDDNLNKVLAQYDEVIDVLLEHGHGGALSDHSKQQHLDLDLIKAQSVQLLQQCEQRNMNQKQIGKDLEEIDDDMTEIDELMKQYGVK